MGEPVAVSKAFHSRGPAPGELFDIQVRIGDRIPCQVGRELDGNHLGTARLHEERQVARRGANLEDPLSREIDMAQVVLLAAAKIPMPALGHAVARYLHHVVEVALVWAADLTRSGIQLWG